MDLAEQDRLAAEKILAVRPFWTKVAPAAELLDLPEGLLLHAGPPFPSPSDITRPILNSAVQSVLFEGWAPDAATTEAMILAGEIRLEPAQERRTCAPLAATISRSMWLQVTEDAAAPQRRAYAPLNTGMTPPLPLGGSDDPATVERHRLVNGEIAPLVAKILGEPIDLLALVDASLKGGDECHGRTGVATTLIRDRAAERLPEGPERDKLLAFLDDAPLFFLYLAMATAKVMMLAAEGTAGSAIVTTAGGNGRQFGIRLAGEPDRWYAADGAPPQGFFFKEELSRLEPLGGIGDSAVIDGIGFGGMALACAPELVALFGKFVPADAMEKPGQLLETSHPRLLEGRCRVAMNARRVVAAQSAPLAVLGILDAGGKGGIIGRGIFTAPLAPYAAALGGLEGK